MFQSKINWILRIDLEIYFFIFLIVNSTINIDSDLSFDNKQYNLDITCQKQEIKAFVGNTLAIFFERLWVTQLFIP